MAKTTNKRPTRRNKAAALNHQVAGLSFAGVAAGIKRKGGRDVALLAVEPGPHGASGTAVFTQNRVKAAPVLLSQRNLAASRGQVLGIVVNSGNANACTGPQGARDAATMVAQTAAVLGCAPAEVLVCSTGVIGQRLPMQAVSRGILQAAAQVRSDGFADFAHGILTTDKRAKVAVRTVTIGGKQVTLLGCTKGAGMIMPNMATTLTFVATDAAVPARLLASLTGQATDATFNAIAVDGDTSTNDTLAVVASGYSAPIAPRSLAAKQFAAALTELLGDLATQLMSDGEGVGHVVGIRVEGAGSALAATQVARRVAISPLVKTAIAGGDPNWGRILCAVGNAGVSVQPGKLELDIAGIPTVRAGTLVDRWPEARVARAMAAPSYEVRIGLGGGRHSARYLACDLTHGYVAINSDYRS